MAPQRNTGSGAEAELPEYAGQYRLEERLGSGGMGVVQLARSTSGLRLAVKVVHAQFARDPEFRGRFRQEVAAARRVSGAFTAPVVDADPEAERPWMATLFIPGPTLAEYVKRNGPMPPDQLRRLMAGLAEALRDIHRVGVVHRDLKPSNVLLADDGPKVIDFGISRPSDSELHTETGKLIGTPPFMAPEQFRRPRQVGPAADIFALGSVMVHAATGRGPFDSDSPYVIAYQVVHDEPDLTDVPTNLAPLVTRCLAKEPEDRPTPDELMRELRSVAASYDTQAFIPAQRAEPSGPDDDPVGSFVDGSVGSSSVDGSSVDGDPPQSKPRPRKRALKRIALVAGALVLTAGGTLATTQLLGQDSSGTSQDQGARSAPIGFTGWDTKPVPGASGMPQCSYGAGKLFCAQPGLVYALDPVDGHVLWRHDSGERSAPDGLPVTSGGLVHAVTHGGGLLEALDPASGRTRWTMDLSAYSRVQHAGGTVLLTGADGTVTGVDGASGESRWSQRIPGQSAPNLAAFAGGGLAYATSTSGDGTSTRVAGLDPETGDVRWDASLKGTLYPVGTQRDTVVFTSVDKNTETDALVQYDPQSKVSHRVEFAVTLPQAQATVRANTVYLVATLGPLVAVDLETRKQRWRLETSVSRGSAPVADTEHVYFTAADGRLLAVDAAKGKLVGQTRTRLGAEADRVPAALSPPLVTGGRVYASAPDGTVFGVAGDDPSAW
ncbi:serine/threonine-protein kinase [Streptomyces sp. NPDC048275]|uniref:serine/threonine-protein kinase n=1 Tax=Streptomyces sp. NPDC048275 TaxID=3155629 RepID=UPI0033FE491C